MKSNSSILVHCNVLALHHVALSLTALHCVVLNCTVLCYTALYCTVLTCIALHCVIIALYYSVFYCIILYYIVLCWYTDTGVLTSHTHTHQVCHVRAQSLLLGVKSKLFVLNLLQAQLDHDTEVRQSFNFTLITADFS